MFDEAKEPKPMSRKKQEAELKGIWKVKIGYKPTMETVHVRASGIQGAISSAILKSEFPEPKNRRTRLKDVCISSCQRVD